MRTIAKCVWSDIIVVINVQDYQYVFNGDGMPKNMYPKHWKGENGMYCAGMSGNGLPGISSDATAIADDISQTLKSLGNLQA